MEFTICIIEGVSNSPSQIIQYDEILFFQETVFKNLFTFFISSRLFF